ncbi:MAG: ribonuclease P protein component, partial [Pontiellaceae bacterium]
NKRNKSRRILREVYRKIRPFLKCNYDILIVSRRSILNVKYIDVFTELLDLLLKADVITKENYDRLILSNGFTNE